MLFTIFRLDVINYVECCPFMSAYKFMDYAKKLCLDNDTMLLYIAVIAAIANLPCSWSFTHIQVH